MDYLMPGNIADRLCSMSVEEIEEHAIVARPQIGQVLESVLWP
jgi:hypothetical protein